MIKRYTNSAVKKTFGWGGDPLVGGQYGFSYMSPYLYMWRGMIQKGVAQCGTYLLTGQWMRQPGSYTIFKCEGGCRIEGVGGLVLAKHGCYFNYGHDDAKRENQLRKLSEMISKVVLEFDPMDPNSIVNSFAEYIDVETETVMEKISECDDRDIGDELSCFFGHNPFGESPMFEIQNYEKWARINFLGEDPKEVKEGLRIKNLGRKLLNDMRDTINKARDNDQYVSIPMCCSPKH